VRQLAYAAQALASSHIKGVTRWPWQTMGRGLVRCDHCEHSWVRGTAPQHSTSCQVGRTQEASAKVLAFVPQCRRDVPMSTATFLEEWQRRDLGALPDRTEVLESPSHDERSDGGTKTGRPGGVPAALPLAPSYQEPLAWNPNLGVVVDRHGNTVANMLLTDLEPLEQKDFGVRIAVCVNFCREIPSDELRRWDRIVSEAADHALEEKQAVAPVETERAN